MVIVQTMKAVKGETFDSLALILWGNEKYAGQLMAANPNVVHLMQFDGGETINIPALEDTSESALPPWKLQTA